MINLLSGLLSAIKKAIGTPAGADLTTMIEDVVTNRLTATRAGYLDLINTNLDDKISSVAQKPPIASGLFGRAVSNAALFNISVTAPKDKFALNNASATAYDTWTSLITISGSGQIGFLAIYQQPSGNASSRDAQARLVVDGLTVWQSDANAWQTPTDDSKGFYINEYAPIPYKTSIVLEFKKTENAAGTVSMTALANVMKTS